MNDAELIDLASRAGLCLPQCWDLAAAIHSDAQNRQWAAAAPTEEERQRRQAIAEQSSAAARQQLQHLRRFAELLLAHHTPANSA